MIALTTSGKLSSIIELGSLRVAKAKNDTVAERYEEQIEHLANEELLLGEKIQSQNVTDRDFGTALDEVFGFIKSPYSYWVLDDMDSKRLALRLVFTEQIAYSSENGFGTPELSLPLRVFKRIGSTNSQDVEMPRVELGSENDHIYESTIRSLALKFKLRDRKLSQSSRNRVCTILVS